jgi:predicted cobalt transporter CbtA
MGDRSRGRRRVVDCADPMIRSLLVRGLVAGLFAGVLAGAFAFAFGEPSIDRAIAIEERQAAGDRAALQEPPPPVGRDAQRAGLVFATSLYGVALGGLFALVFAAVRGRAGALSDSATALRLAAAGFVAVSLVPFLKYPANPPAVGDPETIGARTLLYVVMVAISLLGMLAAWRVSRRPGAPPGAALAAAALYLATVGVAYAVLPGFDEVPEDFPASLLWDFRVAALGTQVVLWSALGVAFGLPVGVGRRPDRRPRAGVG